MPTQTITLPLVDGSDIFGPSFSTDQAITVPLIDGGSTFAPLGGGGTVASPGLSVFNGATELDESFARSFQDDLTGVGSFSISLANADADMPAYDDILRFRVDDTPAFAGLVESKNITTYGPGENVDEVTVVAGRGALALTDFATVETSRGLDALPIEVVRSF
jgi:hypothetical protein